MNSSTVAIVRYQEPLTSVRKAVEMSKGLDHMPAKARVFIKPNIVFWTRSVSFPKWGVITTTRVVGAKLLGYAPEQVPHLMYAIENRNRARDLSDIIVQGEPVESVTQHHEYDFAYRETDDVILPVPLVEQGVKEGVYYHKYDLSMCTYCSLLNGLMLSAIQTAWKKTPFDQVEVLTGKSMQPTPGKEKTISSIGLRLLQFFAQKIGKLFFEGISITKLFEHVTQFILNNLNNCLWPWMI